MFPDLFSIGPLTIHTYGLFVAIGIFVGIMVATKLGKSEGVSPQQVMDMGFIVIISGIIGSRVVYVFMNIGMENNNDPGVRGFCLYSFM